MLAREIGPRPSSRAPLWQLKRDVVALAQAMRYHAVLLIPHTQLVLLW